ncbi:MULTISPECIES: hypothetical protein [Rhizobium]|uniref:hypothetical protein n=1 Tax=Rhizobium TaxID=379 RepID=UPI0028AFAEC7
MSYQGAIDLLNAEVCTGWVIRNGSADESLIVEFYVNGQQVHTEIVDLYRADLVNHAPSGNCGFSFGTSSLLSPGKNVIQLKVLGSDFNFEGFQVTIDERDKTNFVDIGMDDWLFLQNDGNDTDNIVAGNRAFSQNEIRILSDEIQRRVELSSNLDARYITFVVPEKNVVCNNRRIFPVTISPNRPACQLAEAIPNHFVYGLASLKQVFSDPTLAYTKTDTHLSDVGRVGLFPEIMRLLGLESHVEWEHGIFEQFQGDLGSKLTPPVTTTYLTRVPKSHTSNLIDCTSAAVMNAGRLRGSRMYHENSSGFDLTCVLIGTSNAYYSRREFFANFRRCHFYWENCFDAEFMTEVSPDVIVHLATERTISTTWTKNELSITPLVRVSNRHKYQDGLAVG